MRKRLLTFVILMIVLSAPCGLMISKIQIRLTCLSETFKREICLAEDVTFDDSYTLEKYNGPVTINKGSVGSIHDEVNSVLGDNGGEAYIVASFKASNGKTISVFISTDMETDFIPDYCIDINKLEDSKTILGEYKQSRELYRARVRNIQINGTVIGLAVSTLLALLILAVNHYFVKLDNHFKMLVGITLTIDIALVLCVLIGIVLTNR